MSHHSIAHESLTRLDTPEPAVTIDEGRAYLRLRHKRDDPIIQLGLAAAIEDHEAQTGRQLMAATFRLDLDVFPAVIRLRKPPLISVTKLEYLNTGGTLTPLVVETDFVVDAGSPDDVARITPAYGKWWPTTRRQVNAVQVTYSCGFGTDPEKIPAVDRLRVLAVMESLFTNSSGMTNARSPVTLKMVLQQLAWQRRVIRT
jgi:uncharacterized phiE125 gp8 family phage protein